MWNFIKLWAAPAFILFGSINGLITGPMDDRWIFFIGLLIGLGGAWAVWKQTTSGEEIYYSSDRPVRSSMACESCGFYDPQHRLDRCHFCMRPSAHKAPNCICEKCELDRFHAYADH
jgi:hypothetical protein